MTVIARFDCCGGEVPHHDSACRAPRDDRHLFLAGNAHAKGAKPTNPKDAIGVRKVPFSVIPARPLGEVGLALLEGAAKYGRHNYRPAGVRASVYYDAAGRHLTAWWEGQDTDPDSGLSHVTKAIAGLLVLRDSMLQGNWQDDRPPRAADADTWIARLNAQAGEILARYPNPLPPHTQVGSSAGPAPVNRYRCTECGRSWPSSEGPTCPECLP